MNVEDLKNRIYTIVDEWAKQYKDAMERPESSTEVVEVRELPKDKRVVRTKTSGDRVYMIDEIAKTRAWVTTSEILTSLGFTLNDVSEIEDIEMLKYQMAPAIYKIDA
jgi:hypothetical protein